jgi:hypothetical protein
VRVKVTMLLADHADAVGGKLYISGGGWSITGPDPFTCAIAIDIKVPWDQRNLTHEARLELLDADGAPMLLPTPEGEQPLFVEAQFHTGEPADGVKPGSPLDAAFAINLGPLLLPPAQRFEWRLSIDGETSDDWRLTFTTRPAREPA